MNIYIIGIISIYILLYISGCGIAFAQESESLISTGDFTKLKDAILALPGLGTTGLILMLVSVVVAIGVWWWWKGKAKKITIRENEKQRRRDQAENKTENQDITDDWDEANETVEGIRKAGDQPPKKPRPKPPGNS